jgi:hypothetical protein
LNRFTTSVSRRTFLKVTAAGAGALAAPALISRAALASSGELNFMGWAGYPDLAAKVFPAFEKATGIKVIFNEHRRLGFERAHPGLGPQQAEYRQLSARLGRRQDG